MPISPNREYRNAQPFNPAQDGEYIVEGYASTFEPYVMWSYNGVDYSERIDRHAFDECDMSDVIMQYDHQGRVFARQSNGSLELSIDDYGLHVRADLSRSSSAKSLYEDIAAELITRMSFAFTVADDYYDEENHCRVITKLARCYDVSAVSIPANDTTSIGKSARSYFEGVIEMQRQELEKREKQANRIKLLIELEEV